MTRRRRLLAVVTAALAVAAAGCSAPDRGSWATAATAEEGGGFAALVEAAQAEGVLNVIALPPQWAGYGGIVARFQEEYGITVRSADPAGSSQDEIDAVRALGTQDTAPDVLDLGRSYAEQHTDLFAPYRVRTWDTVPAANRHPEGAWVDGYGGYVSLGCNAEVVEVCPQSLADLARPEYEGSVALNGDPTTSASAFAGVWAGALAGGGSLDDIAPGLAFFGDLAARGNLQLVDPTPATIESGATPIVLDWDYVNVPQAEQVAERFAWEVVVPADGVFAQYYSQAVNADAPHPAAARLWQEFLYSDEGQNLWLAGRTRPVRLDALIAAGAADPALLAALPAVGDAPPVPTPAQIGAAQQAVTGGWAAATS
jgi:putative spermidine/putrescine transport system substrate-binding protein